MSGTTAPLPARPDDSSRFERGRFRIAGVTSHMLIIDDPYAPTEAETPEQRKKANDWFTTVIKGRIA